MNRGIFATFACLMALTLVGCGGETPKKETKPAADAKTPAGDKK